MKRILAFVLVLLLCLPLLASCKTEEEEEGSEQVTATGTSLSVIANGASDYTIVYSSGAEMGAAPYSVGKLLQKTIKSATGVELKLVSGQTGSYDKEILIGPVEQANNYPSPVSAETYQKGYSAYIGGEKILLIGGSEAGLRLAAYSLIKELFGIDLLVNPNVTLIEGKTEFTVSSTFAATETLTSEEFPYLGAALADFSVCYEESNYTQKRAAINLQQRIKSMDNVVLTRVNNKSWAEEGKAYFYFEDDKTLAEGTYRIKVTGKKIVVSAKDYIGYEAAVRTVMTLRDVHGFYPFREANENTGTHLESLSRLEETAKYAFEPAGEYRLMFYNVLFDNNDLVERAKLQTSTILAYAPDVIGFQEFRENRRTDIVPIMNANGYEETMDYKKGNINMSGTGTSPSLYNYVPIFYNTATTTCIESGYLRYHAQYSAAESHSKSLCWAVLEDKDSKERYIVVNTHMCTQDDSIKGQQAVEAMEIINELEEKYTDPIFLGGDFNGKYTNSNYLHFVGTGGFRDIEREGIATEYTAKFRAHHKPNPVFDTNLGIMMPGDKDTTGGSPSESVDHILVKNDYAVTIGVYGIVADDYTKSGSDHFPIFVDFDIG